MPDGTTLLAIAGLLLALGFGVFAVWARNNPKTDADIRYATQSVRIAYLSAVHEEVDPSDFRLTYRGASVEEVEDLHVAFRNFGPSRLNADDEEEPVRIELQGEGEILEVFGENIEKINERSARVTLVPMNVDDVRRVLIRHSVRPHSSRPRVRVRGSLRNTPKGIVESKPDPVGRWIRRLATAGRAIPVAVGFAILLATRPDDGTALWETIAVIVGIFALAALLGVVWALVSARWKAGRRAPFVRLRAMRSPFGDRVDRLSRRDFGSIKPHERDADSDERAEYSVYIASRLLNEALRSKRKESD